MKDIVAGTAIKQSRFPPSLFAVLWGSLMLMSGIHVGLIVLMNDFGIRDHIQPVIPILYWALVSAGLTFYTRYKMKSTFEVPVQNLAQAAKQVANGDFSVYVPTLHTEDKWDYLDVMITDFNKMVAELGSVETLKTDFFSNVSHEIKTPLAVIQNTAALLDDGTLTEPQKEHVTAIRRYSQRLTDLITNILKLNKLEKQNIQSVPESYDLCQQLAECALLFEDRWEEKDIEFDADIEDRAFIEADASLLELVWNNLLSNAIKFTKPGGSITLRQVSTAEGIEVAISDTGCGMDEKTLEHIFDKFYQGDTSHSTEGNGLGLALVLRILRMVDGDISVSSKPGKGTTFIVKIPGKGGT